MSADPDQSVAGFGTGTGGANLKQSRNSGCRIGSGRSALNGHDGKVVGARGFEPPTPASRTHFRAMYIQVLGLFFEINQGLILQPNAATRNKTKLFLEQLEQDWSKS